MNRKKTGKDSKVAAKRVSLGPLTFDCRVSGEPGGQCVVLLHGFPETSIMWAGLMEHLSGQGYFCIAPDMRGYSKDACPRGKKHYALKFLVQDILDIAGHFGQERFHLIGHDWGAAVGWHLVAENPARILTWTALSVPHPSAFGRAYKTDPEQHRKSRYIRWFMLPWCPEAYLSRNDMALLRKLWKNSGPEELENYLSVFRRRPCLTGALNYYRANLGGRRRTPTGPVRNPTLFIWGRRDPAIGEAAALGNPKYMEGPYAFLPLDGGHWLIQSNYREVAQAVSEHLARP